jgi:exodeoxyribonuclease VII large subunit
MITQRFSLFELNRMVRESIELSMPDEYWVEAELSECRESRGHCYMELIQKDELSATPVAKASAKCWANKWLAIRPYFERTTGQQLHAGMKVLLKVYPQFHEAYGFSWIVSDIDPTYTLGDMARKRQEIIQKLKAEGVFDLQKELQLPMFCQRIAVISSQTAAGYGDFCNQLADNPYGFQFQTQLFPAIMQGEGVEQSIINALESIYNYQLSTIRSASPLGSSKNYQFDCVAIIRGGGATSDMSGFDTLALAENVANFPIPIITGIGHDRDESILDMVSHTRVKTPTAAAAFLISHLKEVLDIIDGSQELITRYAQQKLSALNTQLSAFSESIPRLFSVVAARQESKLDIFEQRMRTSIERRLTSEYHKLELTNEKLKALDPTLLLARGYSITMLNGRAVKDASLLPPGTAIETRLAKGSVVSKVKG